MTTPEYVRTNLRRDPTLQMNFPFIYKAEVASRNYDIEVVLLLENQDWCQINRCWLSGCPDEIDMSLGASVSHYECYQ